MTRKEDRIRLARQLGLDKPVMLQYVFWLVGNDWVEIDVDGDGKGDIPDLQCTEAYLPDGEGLSLFLRLLYDLKEGSIVFPTGIDGRRLPGG